MSIATVPEKSIQDTIAEALIWDGWLVLRINSGAMKVDDGEGKKRYIEFCRWQALGYPPSAEGVSDLIASRGGYTVYIECKTDSGVQSDEQQIFETACQATGMDYILARDLSDVAHLLTRVEYDGPRPGLRAVEVRDS